MNNNFYQARPDVLNCGPYCPQYVDHISTLFDLIHAPTIHIIETGYSLSAHPICMQAYRQQRRSRVRYLLQQNLHLNRCLLCKNHIHKELLFLWFQATHCELLHSLPPPLQILLRTYFYKAPYIPVNFVLTMFLIEHYNNFRNLDISFIVYGMTRPEYIDKVRSHFTII